MTDYDDTADKSRGTTRRRFLGAVTGLGLLGTVPQATHATPTISSDDYGSHRAQYPKREGLTGFADIYIPRDDDGAIEIAGYWYDDVGPELELKVHASQAHLTMTLSPEEALDVAADLEDAARRASNGGY